MSDSASRVFLLGEARYGFHDSEPYYQIENGKHPSTVKVRPAPGYSHDLELVKQVFAKCEHRFRLDLRPTVFVLKHDSPVGFNGEMKALHVWDSQPDQFHRYLQTPKIILYGKPIPPHPAVTRYLVGHEYGHAVSRHLAYRMTTPSDDSDFLAGYAEMRGIEIVPDDHYGPGTWHRQPTEVFANDFRIVVAGLEPDFWPHAGIPHPQQKLEEPLFRDFWEQVVRYGRAE
jgi:hypothetical protein